MLDCLVPEAVFLSVELLSGVASSKHLDGALCHLALVSEQGGPHLGAGEMLALVQIVGYPLVYLLTSSVVVHKDKVASHRVVEITLVHQSIRAKHYLILLWQKNPLVEIITLYQFYVVPLEDDIVLKQGIAHCFPDLIVLDVLS